MLHHGKPEIPDFRMQLPEHSPVLKFKGSTGHHLPEEVSLRMASSHPVEQKTDRHQPFQNLFWLIFDESKNSLRSRHNHLSVSVADGPLIEIGKGQHVPDHRSDFFKHSGFCQDDQRMDRSEGTGVILQAAFCKRNEPGPAFTDLKTCQLHPHQ